MSAPNWAEGLSERCADVFSGASTDCPACVSEESIDEIHTCNPFVIRWCRKCGTVFNYHEGDDEGHIHLPTAALHNMVLGQIVDMARRGDITPDD